MEKTKVVNLNRSQALIHLVNANVTFAVWPRAGGKTTGGIGPRLNHLANIMPRSQILLYADTFDRIHDRIVPNIIDYLTNELGMEDGEDFVQFKKPPDHWEKPLIPLNKFEHVISFATGTAICGASQKVPGSANAYNAQALIADEAKYLREEKINTEVLPAIRGARKWFGHLPEYRSQWYFTDKWGENIYWILAKRKLTDERKIKAVITLQLAMNELLAKIEDGTATQDECQQYAAMEFRANELRKTLVYVCEAKAFENINAVGEQYFKDLRRDLRPLEYKVAILNEDPETVEATFYPNLDGAFHYHNIVDDHNPDAPLIIAMDYQWRITPLVVAQFGRLQDSVYNTLNFLAGLDTQHPTGGIEQTLELFVGRYYHHRKRIVYYCYDHTAIGRNPAGRTFADIVTSYLRGNGWHVVDVYMGQNPEHNKKFESIKLHMANRADFAIRINKGENFNLLKSLQNAAAILSAGKTKKDKRQEKNLSVPVEESTDYSDAFDQLVWAALELQLVKQVPDDHMPVVFR